MPSGSESLLGSWTLSWLQVAVPPMSLQTIEQFQVPLRIEGGQQQASSRPVQLARSVELLPCDLCI